MKNPMMVYRPDGTVDSLPYDPAILAFEFEGRQIRNPLYEPDGEFHIPAENYGFYHHHTGDGCMALRKDLPNGDYLLLTTEDGSSIPDMIEGSEDAILGRWTADGEALALIVLGNVPEHRLHEIHLEVLDMLTKSVARVGEKAAQLINENAGFITAADEKAGGPMVIPKDILVTLLLRECWEWGPPSTQVEIKVAPGASPAAKRSIRNIQALRTRLGNLS